MNVKEKLQALLTASNATTGETDTTLTDAVQSLIDGYGGGGESVPHIEGVTEYTHAADWTSDALGNAENFARTYCNSDDTTDRRLYVCYVSGNAAPLNYRANYFMLQRYSAASLSSVNIRNNWTSGSALPQSSRSFYITAGSKITVIVFKIGASEGE